MAEIETKLDDLLIRAKAEMADVDVLTAPPLKKECPICFLPFPLFPHSVSGSGSAFLSCCEKMVCSGCYYKNGMANRESGVEIKCAFCRNPMRNECSESDYVNKMNKLVRNGNPDACMEMAKKYTNERFGVPRSERDALEMYIRALEMYIRAAQLGDAAAFRYISEYYQGGLVVERDTSKQRAFLEIAVKKGSIDARHFLACLIAESGDVDNAIQHLKIAASAKQA